MNLTVLKNLISTAIGYGYVSAQTPTSLLSPVESVMMQATPGFVSQGVVDEIVKALAAVAIAALSRWVVSWFDKKKKVEIVATVPIEKKIVLPVEKQPETITLNTETDGNKEKDNPQK